MDNQRIKVLLIEDNPGDAGLIRQALAEARVASSLIPTLDLVYADRLSAGLARLSEYDIDAVLLDLSLPDSQGLDTVVKTHTQRSDIPIVVLTGLDDEIIAVQALQEGAQDYLIKGRIDGPSLIRAVRYALERQRIEEAIRESEERFRAVAQSANEAIVVADSSGKITSWNKGAERLFLYAEHEALGQPVSFMMPEPYRTQHHQGVQRLHTTGESRVIGKTYEGQGLKKDGSQFPVEISLAAWETAKGKFFSAIIRDITERKRAEEAIRNQLERLTALRTIDLAISSSMDLRVTLNILLEQVTTRLSVDATDVLLLSPHTQMLEFVAGRGFRTDALRYTRLRLGTGLAGRATLERRMIQIPDLSKDGNGLDRSPLLAKEGFITYFGVPLIAKGRVRGALEIFHRTRLDPNQEWLDFMEMIAGQAAIAIDNAELYDGLQRANTELVLAYDTTLVGWSRALDLRDKETEGHTQRVAEITERLARTMGMGDAELVQVRRGALLHDIGKMGAPDAILLKPGKLTDAEWVQMRKHPQFAYDMLAPIAYLRPALDIPYCHHEKWDGSGYPRGLQGEQIPLAARIFAVVDVWDALRSDRPYRKAWSEEQARAYLCEQAGKHFDPRVVEAFLQMDK